MSNTEGALAAANRARDQAKAAWEYALEQSRNPRRSAQIPEERRAAWDKQERSTLEAARQRYIAAERAIGEPEQALVWAKLDAKEARIELDEFEKAQRRQAREAARESINEQKWAQIGEAIAHNNATCNPGDPDYIALTVEGYTKLHSRWKLL